MHINEIIAQDPEEIGNIVQINLTTKVIKQLKYIKERVYKGIPYKPYGEVVK